MKFNLTNEVFFNKDKLNSDIQKSLKEANNALIDFFDAQGVDLNIPFTTMTVRDKELLNIRTPLVFNKIVKELSAQKLDKKFIEDIFNLNQVIKNEDAEKKAREFHQKYNLSFNFGIIYTSIYSQGLSIALMILHFNKAIHLPFKFKIPYTHKIINGKKKRVDFGMKVYPKMLQEIRGLDSQSNEDSDSKFLTLDNKEILISYGSKLLISLGWVDFLDVNIEQLLECKEFAYKNKLFNTRPPYQLVITLLGTKCPNDFPINLNEWLKVSHEKTATNKVKRKTNDLINSIDFLSSDSLVNLNQKEINLNWFSTDNLNILKNQMPEISKTISFWEIAEKSYLNRIKRETFKPIKQSLNHLNVYLFFILPTWYKFNNSKHKFPITPGDLKGNIIDNPKLNEKIFYNNNEKTKWGSFYPLFSYGTDGLPYSDNGYKNCWLNILIHFQNIIEDFGFKRIDLVKLLPAGISFNEINQDRKLKEYGSKCKDKCDLRWITDLTPHSARVSVVSHYITALPADVIGQYITGQTEAVVHHYVKLDPTYLTEIEKNQKDGLARLAIKKEFDQLMGKEVNHPILADSENSNIAKSIAINKQETIAKYGCISLNLKEDAKSGIDILIEESNMKLAFNKTEICPYNNNCPSDLIKELKRLRRCGVCPYAVRSIDHLPAIAVKKRQQMELLEEIENKISEASTNQEKYSIEELDNLEEERQRITEELLGWIVSEEMLEANRKRLQDESNTTQYVVKKPEILIQNLQQVSSKESDVEYLLTRLSDCENFPNLDTPMVRAKFDLLRRQLLARLGDFKGAFDSKIPVDPAHECLGLLREVINRFGLTHEQTMKILSTNMLSLGDSEIKPLLELNYVK